MKVETIKIQRFAGGSLLKVFVLGAAPCMGLLLLLTGATTRLSTPPGNGLDCLGPPGDPGPPALQECTRAHQGTGEPDLRRDGRRRGTDRLGAASSSFLLLPLWWGVAGWLAVGTGLWVYSKLCPIEIKVTVPAADRED